MANRVLLLGLLLAACSPVAGPLATYRDPGVILASKADFDTARFSGRWHEVARYPGPGCAGGTVDYAVTAGGLAASETCDGVERRSAFAVSGPGRLAGPSGTQWVLWTDADYRTAVLASPDGSGARVLDRGAVLPDDRRRAVLEVLDFNGFDTGPLVAVR